MKQNVKNKFNRKIVWMKVLLKNRNFIQVFKIFEELENKINFLIFDKFFYIKKLN